MHPPQDQPQAAHLTPETQAIIDSRLRPKQAAQEIENHFGSAVNSPPPVPQPTQQDYEAKERKKVLGMCFTNILAGRMAAVPAFELEKDLGEIAAMWRLAAMCIDGTGQIEKPSF